MVKLIPFPAGHGDCILVQASDPPLNILVDSGPSAPAIHLPLRDKLIAHLGANPCIDLMIVTHYDDDHIGGLTRLLRHEGIEIRNLIFNSPGLIKRFIHERKHAEVHVTAMQACEVSDLLPPLNREVLVAGLDRSYLDKHVCMEVHSPTAGDVLDLGAKMLASLSKEVNIGRVNRDPLQVGTIANLLPLAGRTPTQDRTPANGLSLAFTLRVNGKAILFMGDSWPTRVYASLRERCPQGRLAVNVLTVSHHGSKYNSSVALYSQIDCSRYIVSTDGRAHPDREPFADILKSNQGGNVHFYFPEAKPLLIEMFEGSDLSVVFPQQGSLQVIDV